MQELFLFKYLSLKDYSVQVPKFLQKTTTRLNWRFENTNQIFLTFDDGPTPEITEKVLEILKSFDVKGTFFCIGRNVDRHPELYSKVLEQGMGIGNHTYSHLNGWKNKRQSYIDDVDLASSLISSNLFRPPYGRIRTVQAKALAEQFKIIMWDVLSKDYDFNISPQQCFENVRDYAKAGSIVVFHDSIKAFRNLEYALPKSIEYLLNKGYDLNGILK